MILSHRTLAGEDADAVRVRQIAAAANRARPGRVALALCGHNHCDRMVRRDGVSYLTVNSPNHVWIPFRHKGYPDDAAFEQIAGVVERGTEKGGNWKSKMLVNTGGVDDIRVFVLEMGLCGNLAVIDAFEDGDRVARPRLENHHDLHGDTEQNLRREELTRYFHGVFQCGVGADKTFDVGYRLAVLRTGEQFRAFASGSSPKTTVQDNAQFDEFPFPAHGEKCPRFSSCTILEYPTRPI